MRSHLHPNSIVAGLALTALAACADPSAPVQRATSPEASLDVGGPMGAPAANAPTYVARGVMLHRTRWENYDLMATATVTPDRGGSLVIRSAGLKVTFPKNAVAVPTTVWVTAYAGNRVVYEFGPHGTQFLVPITIEQDLRDTKAYGNSPLARDLFGGYTPNGLNDIDAGDNVQVSEVLGVDLVPDTKRAARWARFYPTHFSGYVLASGRTAY